MDTVILGGTHQVDDYNQNVDADDRRFIYDGCIKLNASIKRAEIINEMVGLRPGRNHVRLERDTFVTSEYNEDHLWLIHFCSRFYFGFFSVNYFYVISENGKQLQIIHNYGHGGSGITLSYGCAIEVGDIVNEIMTNVNTMKSKL